MTSLINHYHTLCKNEHLKEDSAQLEAIKKLATLSQALQKKTQKFFFWQKNSAPKGLYIYGAVGRGKSMLMDIFYDHLKGVSKQRYHFHEFILMIHEEMKLIRDKKEKHEDHPLAQIASKLAQQSRLICFDEFHIKDITDAMLLKRLMGFLWDEEVVIVATSNFLPEDLYKDGYQRNLVLPFLKTVTQKLELHNLNGDLDYRQLFMAEKERYFVGAHTKTTPSLQIIFDHLRQGAPIAPHTLTIKKRDWILPKFSRGVAWFDFDEICGQPLSASDYLELTKHIHTLLLSDIPELDDESLDRVKRFITLIDVLYDQDINFAASGTTALRGLYVGTKEQELFERTLSRLTEMTTRS